METALRFDATRIRELRKGLGLTVEEFAGRINVSKQAVSAWENGDYEPTISSLLKIVNITDAKLSSFFVPDGKTD